MRPRRPWRAGTRAALVLALLAFAGRARADVLDAFVQGGWDTPGLVGIGAAWRPDPHIEVDASVGLAAGLALSLDGRWRFSSGDGGGFLGIGLTEVGGGDLYQCYRAFDETHCSNAVAYHVGSSLALPVFVGWRTPNLWRLWGSIRVGWSFLLAGGKLTAGAQTPDFVDRALDVPKGLVLAIGLGIRVR